jgi:Flp pilus assembly pilin Flp
MKSAAASAHKTTARCQRVRRQRGANMVEYMVLVAMVALAGVAALAKFSTGVDQSADGQGKQVLRLDGAKATAASIPIGTPGGKHAAERWRR